MWRTSNLLSVGHSHILSVEPLKRCISNGRSVVLEVPHCVRNDDAIIGGWGGVSGGEAAAYSALLFFSQTPVIPNAVRNPAGLDAVNLSCENLNVKHNKKARPAKPLEQEKINEKYD